MVKDEPLDKVLKLMLCFKNICTFELLLYRATLLSGRGLWRCFEWLFICPHFHFQSRSQKPIGDFFLIAHTHLLGGINVPIEGLNSLQNTF